MSVVINGEEQVLVGFRYAGTFPVDFLRSDEDFTYTGSGEKNCVVITPRGSVRLRPGDFISRLEDGTLYTTSSASHPQGGASVPRVDDADAPSCGSLDLVDAAGGEGRR
jgi:hypothetical protein